MSRSDRPWFRHLVRISTRLVLGRDRAHAQDRFPGLVIRPGGGQGGSARLFYRGRFVADLHGVEALRRQSGNEVHIVGSGPSVRLMDLAKLPPCSAILLNGAISLIGNSITGATFGPVTEPLAIAIEDERFVYRHFDGIMKAIKPVTICLLSVSVLRAICERDIGWLKDRTVVLIDNILKSYGASRRSYEDVAGLDHVVLNDARTAGVSLDPDRGVFQAGSVAVSALQFAIACAPLRIGFIGIDISNAAEPRFYEKSGTAAFSGVAGAERRILDHIDVAVKAGRQNNIEFLNFSPVSALAKLDLTYDPRLTLPGAGIEGNPRVGDGA